MQPFEQKIEIHFRHTDMAGITYFNEVFNIFHDVYEAWVEKNFESKKAWFNHPEWAVPVKNVSCDYRAPLMPFDFYTVKIELAEVGTTSFKLKTEIKKENTVCAELFTAHVFLNKKTKSAMEIPVQVKEILKK